MDGIIRQVARSDSVLRPEQLLAGAIFQRALEDARTPADRARQHAARFFLLRDTAMFSFWSAVLDVDPSAIRALARHALAGAPPMARQDARPAA